MIIKIGVMTVIRIYGYDGIYSAIDLPGKTCGLEAADGNGEIHCYRLLDGVSSAHREAMRTGGFARSPRPSPPCWMLSNFAGVGEGSNSDDHWKNF